MNLVALTLVRVLLNLAILNIYKYNRKKVSVDIYFMPNTLLDTMDAIKIIFIWFQEPLPSWVFNHGERSK